jgi:peptidoglycan/xylan/chitin deacetylase (PgdA/CDA1 family)
MRSRVLTRIRRWSAELAYAALSALRIDEGLLAWAARRRVTLILNFHRVSPVDNPYWAPLHPRAFEAVLALLRAHGSVRRLADPPLHDGKRADVVLSFDDGYADFVEYAMPLLDRFGFAVNQNVIPASVQSGKPPWNVLVTDFLGQAPPSLLRELALPGLDRTLDATDVAGKMRVGMAVSRHLKFRPRAERVELAQVLDEAMARCDFTPTAMMSRGDIDALRDRVEFGAHSFEHDSMAYESDAFFEDDVARCRAYFAELGIPLSIYAFPNGSYRPSQIETLRREGVAHILLVDDRVTRAARDVHPRIGVYGTSSAEARLRSSGFRARQRVA